MKDEEKLHQQTRATLNSPPICATRARPQVDAAFILVRRFFLTGAPLRGCSSSRCTMRASLFLAAAPLRGWVGRGACMDDEVQQQVPDEEVR